MQSVLPCCLVSLLLLASDGFGQTGSSTTATDSDFDDLARRAAAAVDVRPEEAVNLYQKALAKRPAWPEGWFYLGASEYQLQQFGQASTAFERAVKLAPQNGPAAAFLGLSEYQSGDYSASLGHLEQGIRLGTEGSAHFSSEVHSHLAYLLCRAGLFGPALIGLEPLAKAGDNGQTVITAFGLAVLQRRELPAQVPASERKLVNKAGAAVWAYYAEQPDRANALFQQLVADYPQASGVHYAYGMFLVPRDPDQALAELSRELANDPRHLEALIQSSLLELKRGEVARAVALGGRATLANPDDPLARAAFGRALLKNGQSGKAVSELERAVKLAPQEATFHLYLEQAYSAAGQAERAQTEKTSFLRLRAASAAEVGKGLQPSLLDSAAEVKAAQ